MLCQMCLQAEATIHVSDPRACGPPAQADYCRTCYDFKSIGPPARPPDVPRPRFTINRLMIVAAAFAVPNAAVVLVMRSGWIPGTPAQIRDWTPRALVSANFLCGLLIAYVISAVWLRKMKWHKWTGGLIPMERPRKLGLKGNLFLIAWMAFVGAWFIGGMHVVLRLAPVVWPNWRPQHILLTWIVANPLSILCLLFLVAHRRVRERVRAAWKGASWLERFFGVSILSWVLLILFFLSLSLVSRPGWMSWSVDPWIAVCIVPAVLMGGTMLLLGGLVAATRRR